MYTMKLKLTPADGTAFTHPASRPLVLVEMWKDHFMIRMMIEYHLSIMLLERKGQLLICVS